MKSPLFLIVSVCICNPKASSCAYRDQGITPPLSIATKVLASKVYSNGKLLLQLELIAPNQIRITVSNPSKQADYCLPISMEWYEPVFRQSDGRIIYLFRPSGMDLGMPNKRQLVKLLPGGSISRTYKVDVKRAKRGLAFRVELTPFLSWNKELNHLSKNSSAWIKPGTKWLQEGGK